MIQSSTNQKQKQKKLQMLAQNGKIRRCFTIPKSKPHTDTQKSLRSVFKDVRDVKVYRDVRDVRDITRSTGTLTYLMRYVNVPKKTKDLMLITYLFQRTFFQRTYGAFHRTLLTSLDQQNRGRTDKLTTGCFSSCRCINLMCTLGFSCNHIVMDQKNIFLFALHFQTNQLSLVIV